MTPGRSLFIAGAVLVAAVSWLMLQPRAQHAPFRPPKTAVPATRPSRPPIANDVLASGVALTAAQRQELEALATAWGRESAALEDAVRAAGADFDRFAAKTQAEGRTNLAEVQRQSAELRERSAELRERRQMHSDAALAVLTNEQRRQVSTTRGGVQ